MEDERSKPEEGTLNWVRFRFSLSETNDEDDVVAVVVVHVLFVTIV
jgi:hypothetical protein